MPALLQRSTPKSATSQRSVPAAHALPRVKRLKPGEKARAWLLLQHPDLQDLVCRWFADRSRDEQDQRARLAQNIGPS